MIAPFSGAGVNTTFSQALAAAESTSSQPISDTERLARPRA